MGGEKSGGKKNRTQEDIDSLNRGRERETESWRKQLEDLERGSERAKETFGAKLKSILEMMKKEMEGRENEK